MSLTFCESCEAFCSDILCTLLSFQSGRSHHRQFRRLHSTAMHYSCACRSCEKLVTAKCIAVKTCGALFQLRQQSAQRNRESIWKSNCLFVHSKSLSPSLARLPLEPEGRTEPRHNLMGKGQIRQCVNMQKRRKYRKYT